MKRADPFAVMLSKIGAIEASMPWRARDPSWQARARAAIGAAIGVVDEPWDGAELVELETTREEGYRRTAVEFPSHEGWRGRGWLLTPDSLNRPAPAPAPAVVCLPGHGKGADAIVGVVDEPYQANFALQCVREGWVTLAVEQVSFGANRSARETEADSSCLIDSMAALLLGETITGWRVRDAMAARRALSTLDFVDRDRIGIVGISGGGLTALWTSALDEAFITTGVSGYFCLMSSSILNVRHCPDNYVPGFARLMDIPDLAGLVAPRWLAVENGRRDPLFAAEGFLKACELATEIYSDDPKRFAFDLFEGEHLFKGEVIFSLFREAFREPR